MATKIILIHGNGGGTGSDNWQPYIQYELTKLGIETLSPNFPDPVTARSEYWLPFIESLGTDEDTIIVGHSSGAVAGMRYAETHKLLGLVLVGACYTDLGYEEEKESGYYDAPRDWEAIKDNTQWIIQFASTDDPWISKEEPRYIAEHLNTEYHEYTDRGHFSGGGGHAPVLEFPELLAEIKAKLNIS